ncbi:MAG: outer membrane beta-barrel protein [bacterium]|nr:outer membrane beta-barrel protein [bacterium]
MKRALLVILTLLFVPSLVNAIGPSFALGPFAGLELPLAQSDQAKGSTFGVRGIVKALPVISLEPHLTFTNYGDPSFEKASITNDLEGSKVTSYGINAIIGAPVGAPGFRPFFLGGIGLYKATRDQTTAFSDESTDLGYSLGLGAGIPATPVLGVDIRGQFTIVPVESKSSKKSVSISAGVTYSFGVK